MQHTILRQKIKRLTASGVDHVVASYTAGESADSIAERLGVSPPGIRKWLHKRGVEVRHQAVYNEEQRRAAWRKRRNRNSASLKEQAIEAYGGVCECCGEHALGLLTLDHIDPIGGGRRGRTGGVILYRKLRRDGWPTENVRVLCWNCNCGRQWNLGVCPHESLRPIQTNMERYRHRLKVQMIAAYGDSCCDCCGETNIGFLTLDHLRGTEDRSVCGATLYARLRMAGWPRKEDHKVRCFNCNCGRQYNGGVCPHLGVTPCSTLS